MLPVLDIVGAAAEQLEGLVHRAVEQHVVIGHVEMAVVVDPAGSTVITEETKGAKNSGSRSRRSSMHTNPTVGRFSIVMCARRKRKFGQDRGFFLPQRFAVAAGVLIT